MPKTHFILDEAAILQGMECIMDAIDKYRGYGVRLQLYYQSPAQLKECFPNGQDQVVLANVTQIYFGINDQSAEYVSGRLGDETIVVASGGSSTSYNSQSSMQGPTFGESTTSNENWSLMGRRLLKPEEIYALNERAAITFVPGLPPILTRLERYYESRPYEIRFPRIRAFVNSMLLLSGATLWLFAMLMFLKGAMHV